MTVHQSTGKLLAASVSSETSLRKRLPAGTLAVEVDTGELQLADGRTPGGFNPKLAHSEAPDAWLKGYTLSIFVLENTSSGTWTVNQPHVLADVGLSLETVGLTVTKHGASGSETEDLVFRAHISQIILSGEGWTSVTFSDAKVTTSSGSVYDVATSPSVSQNSWIRTIEIEPLSLDYSPVPVTTVDSSAFWVTVPVDDSGYVMAGITTDGTELSMVKETGEALTLTLPMTLTENGDYDVYFHDSDMLQETYILALLVLEKSTQKLQAYRLYVQGGELEAVPFSDEPVYLGSSLVGDLVEVRMFTNSITVYSAREGDWKVYAGVIWPDGRNSDPVAVNLYRSVISDFNFAWDGPQPFYTYNQAAKLSDGRTSYTIISNHSMAYRTSHTSLITDTGTVLPAFTASLADFYANLSVSAASAKLIPAASICYTAERATFTVVLGSGDTIDGRNMEGTVLHMMFNLVDTTQPPTVLNLSGLTDLDYGLLLKHGTPADINNHNSAKLFLFPDGRLNVQRNETDEFAIYEPVYDLAQ